MMSVPATGDVAGPPGAEDSAPDRSRPLRWRVVTVVGIQLVLLLGLWGIAADRGDDRAASAPVAVGQPVGFPDGSMLVRTVIPWSSSEHTMAGMQVPDPVPKGRRRVIVDVTLRADAGRSLAYRPEAFAVTADGLGRTAPHWASPGIPRVAPGAQATVSVVFEVPASVAGLVLEIDGADGRVALEPAASATPPAHGDAPAHSGPTAGAPTP